MGCAGAEARFSTGSGSPNVSEQLILRQAARLDQSQAKFDNAQATAQVQSGQIEVAKLQLQATAQADQLQSQKDTLGLVATVVAQIPVAEKARQDNEIKIRQIEVDQASASTAGWQMTILVMSGMIAIVLAGRMVTKAMIEMKTIQTKQPVSKIEVLDDMIGRKTYRIADEPKVKTTRLAKPYTVGDFADIANQAEQAENSIVVWRPINESQIQNNQGYIFTMPSQEQMAQMREELYAN